MEVKRFFIPFYILCTKYTFKLTRVYDENEFYCFREEIDEYDNEYYIKFSTRMVEISEKIYTIQPFLIKEFRDTKVYKFRDEEKGRYWNFRSEWLSHKKFYKNLLNGWVQPGLFLGE